jgi:hypothetical protein
MGWRKLASDFMHVAPGPSLSGHNRTHHGMLCFVEMFGRVFAGRRVATAHMAASHALAQRHPASALFQAFFAGEWQGRRRKVGLGKMLQMFTWLAHTFAPLDLGLDGFRFASNG